ncbi:unnamed protein product [Albugo candida]|uniref:Uncharacterized protein n=1 Tax=Albugo candida TaxID=65357 RepID=A0A024FZC5_9STRA|nr:unnamed protein product [Albugo candida]|eukprot:CCI39380.1 unnamed protein product [Albugo candida]
MDTLKFPLASKHVPAVKVYECPKPTWKRPSLDAKSTKATASHMAGDQSKIGVRGMFKKATNSEYEQDFKHVLDSVCGFAYDNTRGKEKKHLKTKRVEALGGKRTKNETQPYHIMMAIQKAAEKREKRRQEEQKRSDLVSKRVKVSGASRLKNQRSNKKGKGRSIDYGIQATKGEFKNGILNVQKLR